MLLYNSDSNGFYSHHKLAMKISIAKWNMVNLLSLKPISCFTWEHLKISKIEQAINNLIWRKLILFIKYPKLNNFTQFPTFSICLNLQNSTVRETAINTFPDF